MAIAFDNVSTGGFPGSGATQSYTCNGSNRALVVFAETTITGVVCTYNGVTMTSLDQFSSNIVGTRQFYCWYLPNPASGANNIVYSPNLDSGAVGFIASYTGVDQISTTPDVNHHVIATNVGSITDSVNTTIDNEWLVGFIWGIAGNNPSLTTPFSNWHTRQGGAGPQAIGDSNAALTPPAGYTFGSNFTATMSGSNGVILKTISLRPPASNFASSLSDSVLNGASRFVSLSSLGSYFRSLSVSIMNSSSRFVTVGRSFFSNLSVSIMNAAARFVTNSFSYAVARTVNILKPILESFNYRPSADIQINRVNIELDIQKPVVSYK